MKLIDWARVPTVTGCLFAAAMACVTSACQIPEPDILFAATDVGDVLEEVVASGAVSARTKVNVGSQISGTVHTVAADIGQEVHAGDVLATLDTRLLDAQAKRARATLRKAQAQSLQAELVRTSSERAWRRMATLAKDAMTARADEESAALAHAQSTAALTVAQAAVEEAQADVQTAATSIVLATLRSPIDGIVIDRQMEAGQTVAAQFQVATLFTIAQDMAQVVVHAAIDEADMGRVRVGMPVQFFVDAYPERAFAGSLQVLRPAPQGAPGAAPQDAAAGGVVTYLAEIAADNGDHALWQGMTVQVRITTARHNQVVRVPAAALRFRPQSAPPSEGSSPKAQVYVSGDNGALRAQEVSLGLCDGALCEVTSGLAPRTQVAVAQSAASSGSGGSKRGRRGMF